GPRDRCLPGHGPIQRGGGALSEGVADLAGGGAGEVDADVAGAGAGRRGGGGAGAGGLRRGGAEGGAGGAGAEAAPHDGGGHAEPALAGDAGVLVDRVGRPRWCRPDPGRAVRGAKRAAPAASGGPGAPVDDGVEGDDDGADGAAGSRARHGRGGARAGVRVMGESRQPFEAESGRLAAGEEASSAATLVCDPVDGGQRARERRLAAAFEQAAIGMAVLRQDWRWLEVNPRLLELLGYDEAELRAQAFHDLVHPAHRVDHLVLARRLSRGRLDTYALEQRLVRKDGTAVWVDLKAVRARMPAGGEDHIVIVVEEVGERREALEALRTAQQLQEALLCNIPEAAWLKTADGRYLAVNYAFARACGWTRSEVVGRTDRDIWPEEQAARYQEEDARVLESGQPLLTEEYLDAGDGVVRWYETVRAPVRDAAGNWIGTVGVRRDITERKQAEEALRRSEEQLRQVLKLEAVGRLAGGIAHDFNNILTAVGGHATLLLDEIRPGDPMRADIEEIKRGVDRAASLTRQLLAFSRKQVLKPRVLDLTSVVADTERMLRRLIGEDIELRTCAETGLGRVQADPGQIQQVILNLAVNARDAMPDGGRLSIELANVDVDEHMAHCHMPVQ